jgi:predicted ribosome quality control (RQC) complex YloA/Tae2 family protein
MALDGIVISNIVKELSDTLTGGRIHKIAQPEADELLLTIKTNRKQQRLFLSAGASLPLVYLTEENKPSPMTAPNFCMLLRKHLNSARILSITQPGLERIIRFEIEHLNEMGDLCRKFLIVELMGKHSNIIFCDENEKIVDSIKHISGMVSSVREVLPGRDYFIPNTQDKLSPLSLTWDLYKEHVLARPLPLTKAIYTSLTGFSPVMANEACYRAGIDGGQPANCLEEEKQLLLYTVLEEMVTDIRHEHFYPAVITKNGAPVEFASLALTCYTDFPEYGETRYESISRLLEDYYAAKNALTRIRQKSVDLRKIVSNALERCRKKLDLQEKQLKDTEKREKYKVYGELLTTYGYSAAPGDKSLTAMNYYTNEEITIPLDPTLTAMENAKKYFEKYGKLKRTFEAVTVQLEENRDELLHLESVSNALDIARNENDLAAIKEELTACGYIRRKYSGKKEKKQKLVNKPFHYRSSDGYDIYIGKNNFQNDELTFQFATGNDWWFHAKGCAGSHVIVKTNGDELPDRTFEEAARLAAYYSKARDAGKAEIDYIQKKHVKKPNGSKPGFVVYYTNYSMAIAPDISGIELVSD